MNLVRARVRNLTDESILRDIHHENPDKARLLSPLKKVFKKLHLGRRQKKNEVPDPSDPSAISQTLPAHFTFFSLPPELRNLVYEFIWLNNGMDYIREQLRGFTSGTPHNFSCNFQSLQTCRQFYQEAFCFAYRQTCFYYFRSYAYTTLASHFSRFQPSQIENIRHIAFWSNPYLSEDFIDYIPSTLTNITICSNYMSGAIPEAALSERAQWIIDLIKMVKSLKRFHFRTGCSLSPATLKLDWEFALKVREAFNSPLAAKEGFSIGPFDSKTHTSTLTIHGSDDELPRSVELMVASIYEVER
jgi:hypothetical protein